MSSKSVRTKVSEAEARHPASTHSATLALCHRNVSIQGAHQFLDGQIVASPGDRHLLAAIAKDELDLTAVIHGSHIALLIPAVQAAHSSKLPDRTRTIDKNETITIHGNRTETIWKRGITIFGANQFFAGLPVSDADDRQAIAASFISQFV